MKLKEDKHGSANGLNINAVHIEGDFKWEQDTLNKEVEKGTYFLIKTEKCSIRFQRQNTEDSYKTPTKDFESLFWQRRVKLAILHFFHVFVVD